MSAAPHKAVYVSFDNKEAFKSEAKVVVPRLGLIKTKEVVKEEKHEETEILKKREVENNLGTFRSCPNAIDEERNS